MDSLKKHCQGYQNKGEGKGFIESVHVKSAKARDDREGKELPPAPPTIPPTIIVNIPNDKMKEERQEPPAKKPRSSGTLDTFLNSGKDKTTFLKDLVIAFAGVITLVSLHVPVAFLPRE